MTLQQMQEASRVRLEAILGAWTEQPTGKTKQLLQEYRASYLEINQILKDELAGQIHALALHTYTPEEWTQKHGNAPMSPPCDNPE